MTYHRMKGFTMVEIMLVVIIIGVLAAMVVPNLAGRGQQARKVAARADIETSLPQALDLYEMDNGGFPSTDQGLKSLIEKPSTGTDSWSGPYLKKKKIPKDPWETDYVYVCPGVHNKDSYDLSSYGPDKIESADDITNWEKTNQE